MIINADFLISVADKSQILDLGLDEYVFVGRSNCGKSSLINFLTNRKNLAKTSSTPGLTKLINYFLINNTNKNEILTKIKNKESVSEKEGFLFVDLPGYGYSIAGKKNHSLWSKLIDFYLKNSENIKKVLVLVDIRHEPSELDKQMIQYLYFNVIPFAVVVTKADKIAKTKIKKQVDLIAKSLRLGSDNLIPCSSSSGYGKEKLLSIFQPQG